MICSLLFKLRGLKSEFYNGFKVHKMLLLCQPKYLITHTILSSCWMTENASFFVVCTKFVKWRKIIHTVPSAFKNLEPLPHQGKF